jgi:hypothetical protein
LPGFCNEARATRNSDRQSAIPVAFSAAARAAAGEFSVNPFQPGIAAATQLHSQFAIA